MAGVEEYTQRDQALRRFQRELRQFEQIPGAPEVLGKVLELTAADTVSTRTLAEIVACDPALTARLLALANTWVVGSPRAVASVPQAILLLGFSQVRDLAAGLSAWTQLGEARGITPTRRHALWTHSATVAAVAKRLAQRAGVDPGRAFVCGLLHDVGKLVLGLRLGDSYWSMLEAANRRGGDLVRMEMDATGCHHGTVGGWLLSLWRLPAPIVAAISHHHGGSSGDQLADVAAVGDAIVVAAEISTEHCEEAIRNVDLPAHSARLTRALDVVKLYADAVDETTRLMRLLA